MVPVPASLPAPLFLSHPQELLITVRVEESDIRHWDPERVKEMAVLVFTNGRLPQCSSFSNPFTIAKRRPKS